MLRPSTKPSETLFSGLQFGVKAVEKILIRWRGWFDWRVFKELTFKVAPNELIRLANDPRFPDRGSLKIIMEGGT